MLRHPASVWNEENIHQGQSRDAPGLSEHGKKQALAIARFFTRFSIRSIWSSPLLRASELANEIGQYHPETPLFFEDTLKEMTHGAIDGMHVDQIRETFPRSWKRWRENTYDPELPCFQGGESPLAAAQRWIRIAERIARISACTHLPCLTDSRITVMVTHGALLSFGLALMEERPLTSAFADPLHNGSITILGWTGERLLLKQRNIISHLGDMLSTPNITI